MPTPPTPEADRSQLGDALLAAVNRHAALRPIEQKWEGWVRQMFPGHVTHDFAPHHRELWSWAWGMDDERPRPFVAMWPRGGGKSSTVELLTVALGARRVRRYAVCVAGTQAQADERVEGISDLIEGATIAQHYPDLGARAVSKYGHAKGWRRSRLWTRHGFVVDALGLDTAVRGVKIEGQRPDLIVLDDLDARHDTVKQSDKKEVTLTQSVLPIGAANAAVVAVQNVIIPHGLFGRMARGQAAYLADRIVSGPVPAIEGLATEQVVTEEGVVRRVITAGEPTWTGQGLEHCQQLIDQLGWPAFQREQQHKVWEREGALWRREIIRYLDRLPDDNDDPLVRVVVGVDPSGGAAEIGIVAVGLLRSGLAVVLEDNTQPGRKGVDNWSQEVGGSYDRWQGDVVAAERNFGGDMVEHVIRVGHDGAIAVKLVNASRGKAVRAEPVVQQYARGKVAHLGAHPELETEMTQWVPGDSSPNRLDALVWALTELFWPTAAAVTGAAPRYAGW